MRSIAIIVLAASLMFFLIGTYELSKARATAGWPARPAKITAYQEHTGDDAGRYVTIDGVFVDTGGTFQVKRYAYGVLNGMVPGQAHLVPYKPGFMTTVYVDPDDGMNVILCNTPSLTFQYGELVGTALLALASLGFLIFRRKKRGADDDSIRAPRSTTRTVELPRWAGLLIGLGMAFLFLGLGTWIIHMGLVGHSPAETWSPGQAKGAVFMGLLFAYGGLQSLVLVIGGDRLPKMAHQVIVLCFPRPSFRSHPDRRSRRDFVVHLRQRGRRPCVARLLRGRGRLHGRRDSLPGGGRLALAMVEEEGVDA